MSKLVRTWLSAERMSYNGAPPADDLRPLVDSVNISPHSSQSGFAQAQSHVSQVTVL